MVRSVKIPARDSEIVMLKQFFKVFFCTYRGEQHFTCCSKESSQILPLWMADSSVNQSLPKASHGKLPWDIIELFDDKCGPTKEQIAVYLKAHSSLAFLTKYRLQNSIKSVLKNRKLTQLRNAYEEFAELKPFATEEERIAEQAVLDQEASEKAATKAAAKAAAAAASTSVTNEGDAGDGGASKKKKRKKKKKKKAGTGEILTILSKGNGQTGSKRAHGINLGGFTDSYVRWGQV